MAERPIYKPCYESDLLVQTEFVEFTWYAGMAPSQRQKSVESLHQSAKDSGNCRHPLEVSSKSLEPLGIQLSAFNLTVKTEKYQREFTVETAYQSSKVFQNGGSYKELLYGTSIEAKKDQRLKESGSLKYFEFLVLNGHWNPKRPFVIEFTSMH